MFKSVKVKKSRNQESKKYFQKWKKQQKEIDHSPARQSILRQNYVNDKKATLEIRNEMFPSIKPFSLQKKTKKCVLIVTSPCCLNILANLSLSIVITNSL